MKQKSLLLFILFTVVSCGGDQATKKAEKDTVYQPLEFYGNAQGTTFSIICGDSIDIETKDIEIVLDAFDLMLSTYIDSSLISRMNNAGSGPFEYQDAKGYFNRCIRVSQNVHRLTDGAFDPTIYPLWSEWDFNKDGFVPDSARIDSLLQYVGFENERHFSFTFEADTNDQYNLTKNTANAKMGFDGVAQGLAVDVLAELLEAKGAKNYYVEIGGEIRVKGVNSEGELWRIGIDKPIDGSTAENREIQKIMQLQNKSMATSGSYRKFFVQDDVKYSHTIDPRTGYPVKHSLLSVTVVAESCAMADALATAFMVMGSQKTMAFVKEHPELELEVYLIFENKKGRMETYYTRNFRDSVID